MKRIVGIGALVAILLFPYVTYREGKHVADRWYHSHSEDCSFEVKFKDNHYHQVCTWVPVEKREVISGTLPDHPQVTLDTVENFGCARVLWNNETFYLQGIPCPEASR